MKFLFAAVLLTFGISALAADLKPSGPAKLFEGPEGESFILLEVNDSKQALVQFKGVGGEWDGKTFLWNFDRQSQDRAEAWYEKKRGSKMIRYVPVVSRNMTWSIYPPDKKEMGGFRYSKEGSKDLKSEEIIKSYKP